MRTPSTNALPVTSLPEHRAGERCASLVSPSTRSSAQPPPMRPKSKPPIVKEDAAQHPGRLAVRREDAKRQQFVAEAQARLFHQPHFNHKGFAALQQPAHLHRVLREEGRHLVLAGANAQPLSLLRRSGFLTLLGEANLQPDLPAALERARGLAGPTTIAP